MEVQKHSMKIDGKEALVEWISINANTIDITHTYVPPELRGQGLAEKLVKAALEQARSQGKKVKASCSYAKSYLDTHPEFDDLKA